LPTPTYTPLATVTLGTAVSSVTFSSIPATYRDLILVSQVRSTRAATDDDLYLQFNNDTGNNYSWVRMAGNGSTTASSSGTGVNYMRVGNDITAANSTANVFANVVAQIQDASATDKHKTGLSRSDNSLVATYALAHRWANTNAITTVKVYCAVGSLAAGSTLNLYGVIA
jgi:hypothetical protein